jgi:hypothetical protein
LDGDLGSEAVVERERMEERGGAGEDDAGEEREVVAGLEEAEVFGQGGKGEVGVVEAAGVGTSGPEIELPLALVGDERIEERELGGLDGGAVRVLGEEVAGVHRDQDRGVGVRFGDDFEGASADTEVLGEIDLLKGGVLADEVGAEGGGFALSGEERFLVACGPPVVVAADSLDDVGSGDGCAEEWVAPACGELAGELGVVWVADQPPSARSLGA